MNNLFRSITLLLLMFILGSVSAQNQSLNVKGTVRDAMEIGRASCRERV